MKRSVIIRDTGKLTHKLRAEILYRPVETVTPEGRRRFEPQEKALCLDFSCRGPWGLRPEAIEKIEAALFGREAVIPPSCCRYLSWTEGFRELRLFASLSIYEDTEAARKIHEIISMLMDSGSYIRAGESVENRNARVAAK